MSDDASHREVPVRVKVMVDERIAPVVCALHDFQDLFTETSCQGYAPDGPGMVTFRYGEDWNQATIFCLWLQEELRQRQEEAAAVSISCGRHFHVTGRLDVNWSAVERVTAEIRGMAYKFTATTLQDALEACTGQ